MWKNDEVQKVTRSNKEVSNREELEWLVNEITRKVTVQNKIQIHQMMSNRKCFLI